MTDSQLQDNAGINPATHFTNDALAQAAETAKTTASRNIPSLGDLPIAEATANLRFGPSLHDGLLALLPLVGVWRGEGQADTPERGQYEFQQQLTFSHNGENYIQVHSLCWIKNTDARQSAPENSSQESSQETPQESSQGLPHKPAEYVIEEEEYGFLRIDDKDNIEFISTNAAGVVEIMYGEPINERAWQLSSASTMVTESGPSTLRAGKRLYGLMPDGSLGWVEERIVGEELRPRKSAQLSRYIG